jgi:RNA polymerase sigma-70 factor, ECF subfamily
MKISRAEFEKLALEQLDAVDRVARSLARNPAEADDLVQETYVRALRAADSFDLQSFGIRPWLFRILHNLHTTRATRESRQPRAITEEHLQSFADPGEPFAAGTFSGTGEIEAAMQELPGELSSTLMLWAIDDLAYKEIAEVMDVPIGTVMSRLHRARQKLAERLQPFAPKGRGPSE